MKHVNCRPTPGLGRNQGWRFRADMGPVVRVSAKY